MNTEEVSGGGVNVPQAQLDRWRAFAAQTLRDVREVRRLLARGQATAADQLLGAMHDSAGVAGVTMDDAGANRPARMLPKPTGAALEAAEREANE